MREIDRRIAALRLRLAEIKSRQEQLTALHRQYNSQIERVTEYAIYEKSDLDSALSMLDEVDARLLQTERTQQRLSAIRQRCQEELDALLLTRSIEAAKSELAELEVRRREVIAQLERLKIAETEETRPDADVRQREHQLQQQHAQIDAEMKRLRQTISEASEQAARAVSSRGRSRQRVMGEE